MYHEDGLEIVLLGRLHEGKESPATSSALHNDTHDISRSRQVYIDLSKILPYYRAGLRPNIGLLAEFLPPGANALHIRALTRDDDGQHVYSKVLIAGKDLHFGSEHAQTVWKDVRIPKTWLVKKIPDESEIRGLPTMDPGSLTIWVTRGTTDDIEPATTATRASKAYQTQRAASSFRRLPGPEGEPYRFEWLLLPHSLPTSKRVAKKRGRANDKISDITHGAHSKPRRIADGASSRLRASNGKFQADAATRPGENLMGGDSDDEEQLPHMKEEPKDASHIPAQADDSLAKCAQARPAASQPVSSEPRGVAKGRNATSSKRKPSGEDEADETISDVEDQLEEVQLRRKLRALKKKDKVQA